MGMFRTAVLLAGMTALFGIVGLGLGGKTGLVIALVMAAGVNLFAWWGSDKMVLRMHNARPAGAGDRGLVEMVARLARQANMPVPDVYVIETAQPNAFATGRSPEHAAVAATTGLLRALSPEEIEGVIAHELAHIRNRDTLTMTITATLAGAITTLANFAFFFRGGNGDRGIGPLGTIAMMILAPMAAAIVQMAISRTREYEADRIGAEICGRPLWLASALKRIEALAGRVDMDTAERNPATAHMFIINPLHAHARDALFSTHPSTANRVAALEHMAGSRPEPDRTPRREIRARQSSVPRAGHRSGSGSGSGSGNPWS